MDQKRELTPEEMNRVSGGTAEDDKSINRGQVMIDCPTCGQPVAAASGVTSGICPHCGNAIPAGIH